MKKATKKRMLAVMLATTMTAGSVSGNGSLFPVSVEAATKAVADLQNPTVKNGMTTWDCIWFGNYYQSDASGKLKDPIKWRVLSIDGNDAFLLADKALDQMPYCEGTVVDPEPDKWGNIKTELKTDTLYWENCTLRSFLNGYDGSQNVTELDYTEDNFLDTAFSKEEQEGILTTTVTADANPDKNSPQGKDTEDKVYVLSVKEARDKSYGFSSNEARRYYNTPNYTFVGGRSGEKGKIGVGQEIGYSWWTRTSGQEYSGRYVYPVSSGLYGDIETQGGYGESPGFGVRPAMHVDLSKVEGLWEYAGTVNSDGSMAEENAKDPAVPGTGEGEKTPEPEKTKEPDVTNTPEPTEKVTEKPEKTKTPEPTGEVTKKPDTTEEPTKSPDAKGTPEPTVTTTPEPAGTATPKPDETVKPSMTPTEKPQSTPYSNENTIPILNIEIDESKGTIADMHNDNEHNKKCYGSMSFSIPEGYTSEYGTNGIKSNEALELDYIKGRGNASWHTGDKKPYKIKLKEKADLFGMGANKHWVLINPTNADSTFMKNKLLYDWAAKIGSKYAPQSVFVDVVMNGEYVGHYLLCEHVRVGKTRVDIDDIDEAKPGDKDTLTGGYLINCDDYALMSENYFTTKNKVCYEIVSPSLENTTEERKNYIIDYVERLEEAVSSDTFTNAKGERYSDLMDVDSFVNYFLVQLFSNNFDAFHNSTYLYKERGGKLYWGPVWDFDHSMSGINDATSNSVVNGSSRKFVKDLLRDPEMARKVQERYIEVRESLVELYQNGGTVDRYANQIRVSANHDIDKWGGNYVYYFDEEIDDFKEWIAARIQFMDRYIPTLIEEHYTVTLDYANGEKRGEVYAAQGMTIEVPDVPELKEHTFLGWYYQENGQEKMFTRDTKVQANMLLTAKWKTKEKTTYQLTFDAQDGILTGSQEYAGKPIYSLQLVENTQITINPKAVRSGYRFDGWYFDKEGNEQMAENGVMGLVKDTTLYARWTKLVTGTPKGLTLKKAGKKLNIKFSKVSGAKGYEVVYGTNKKLTKGTKKTIAGTSYTTGKLKKGTYYVKIRAYQFDSTGKKIYGQYKIKKIKMK